MNDFDVGIVGMGFAGLSAAKMALSQNLRVALVGGKQGATQHFSGAFDWIDPRITDAALNYASFSLVESAQAFLKAHPKHIYSQLTSVAPEDLAQAIGELKSVLQFYNMPFAGDGQTGVWALGSAGFFKPCAFAGVTQAFDPSALTRKSKILVLGFLGVTDYFAPSIAKNLSSVFADVQSEELADFATMPAAPYVSLVRQMQDEAAFERFRQILRERLKRFDAVIVPPLLSLAFSLQLQNEFGARVREMLSALPSVAGLRWGESVKTVLAKNPISVFEAQATKFDVDPQINVVKSLKIERQNQTEFLNAKHWILATGKFVGGGVVEKRDTFFEPLLDLPLFVNDAPVSKNTHITKLIHKDALASQDFLKLGVAYADAQRPRNVHVCGHLLTGFDFAREHCGFGVSVLSAKRALAEMLRITPSYS